MEGPVSLIVADGLVLVRSAVRRIVEGMRGFHVVAECEGGDAVVEALEHLKPNILVINSGLSASGNSGIDFVRSIQRRFQELATIVLTNAGGNGECRQAMELGVRGYVLLNDIEQEFGTALAEVARGGWHVSPSLRRTNGLAPRNVSVRDDRLQQLQALTPTELRVYYLVAQCMSTREIADNLCISPRTVDHHREHICRKLNLNGRYSLVRHAMNLRR